MPISCYNTKSVIELLMASAMILSIIGIYVRSILDRDGVEEIHDHVANTTTSKKKRVKGIGARTIQFASVTLIIPSIIILGLENVLHGETIATIIGGMIGYVLSGVGDYGKSKSD